MPQREFPLGGVRRADAGPVQRGHKIVCSRCRADDAVIVTGSNKVVPGNIVAKRFAASGWVVGSDAGGDLCPDCAAKRSPGKPKESLPMVVKKPVAPAPVVVAAGAALAAAVVDAAPPAATPARTEDARKARLDVDMLLVDNFRPAEGRYRDGWDDERVAREAGMSVDFVARRREAEHGPLKVDVPRDALAARLAEFSVREMETRGRVAAAERAVREAFAALAVTLNEMRALCGEHLSALRKLADGK